MDREAVFEVGIVGLATVVFAGVALLLGSGLVGGLLRRKRHHEAMPEPGSIAAERHHHILAPAAH
jgi:hypothetical protein